MLIFFELALMLIFLFLLPLYFYAFKVVIKYFGLLGCAAINLFEEIIVMVVELIESSSKNAPIIYKLSIRVLSIIIPVFISMIVTWILLKIILVFLDFFDHINYAQLNVFKLPYNLMKNILTNPQPIVFIGIGVFFLWQYHLYKWIIRKFRSILVKNFLDYEKKIIKFANTAFNDFTVLIAWFGFLPMLLDSLFGTQHLSEEMQNTVLLFFILIISPYTYLLYKN